MILSFVRDDRRSKKQGGGQRNNNKGRPGRRLSWTSGANDAENQSEGNQRGEKTRTVSCSADIGQDDKRYVYDQFV